MISTLKQSIPRASPFILSLINTRAKEWRDDAFLTGAHEIGCCAKALKFSQITRDFGKCVFYLFVDTMKFKQFLRASGPNLLTIESQNALKITITVALILEPFVICMSRDNIRSENLNVPLFAVSPNSALSLGRRKF